MYYSATSLPKNILGSWLQKFKYYMPFEITRAKGEGFSLAFKTNADIHDILLTEEVEEGPTRGAEQVSQGSEMPQKELPPLQYQQALQALIEEIEENPDISKGLLPETLKALAKEMQKRGNHSMVLKFRLERIEILEGEDQAHALVTLAQICANASDYIFADEIVQRAIKHPAISQNDLINAYIAQGRILRGLHQEKNGNIEPQVQVLGKRIKL